MNNYWLEYVLEKDTGLRRDFTRIQLLESLIRSTAQFGVELGNYLAPPSMLEYDGIIQNHASDSCNPDKVREWVYLSLLQKAVQDANAVALLTRESLSKQAINLWRSLFETDVICQYIAKKPSDVHLACRYAIHSIIRSTVRRWEEFNRHCCGLGKPAHYSTKEIEHRKSLYRAQVGEWGNDYAWTKEHKSFGAIAQDTRSEMIFYRVANNEVHPTFGETMMLSDMRLPLPAVPLLPIDITYNAGQLSVEYQTARLLTNTTGRATDYTTLPTHLQDGLTALEQLGESVSRGLLQMGHSRPK